MSQHGGVCRTWGMVRVGWRISYLSCRCDKNTGQKQFKTGRVYSGSQFEDTARCGIGRRGGGTPPVVAWVAGGGGGWGRGREGMNLRQWSHYVHSPEKELDAGVLSAFPFLFSPGPQPTGHCHPFLNQSRSSRWRCRYF